MTTRQDRHISYLPLSLLKSQLPKLKLNEERTHGNLCNYLIVSLEINQNKPLLYN